MTIIELLTAIEDSALAQMISKTDHLVAAGLQVIHVLGLILFLAALVLISLRAVGWALANHSIADVVSDASRLLWAGFALTVLSGTLMFVATPQLYYFNSAFGVKMGLLVLAVVVQATSFRRVARSDTASPSFVRRSVALSVACWLGVAMAGRMIGFI